MFNDIKEKYTKNILTTYARQDVCFTHGEGVYLYDTENKRYLDFASGIGVNSVGYAHPKWIKAVSEQAAKLAHVSNLYYTQEGGLLAEKLCKLSGLSGGVFFSNSGAEANEGLVKLARKHSADNYNDPERYIIATLQKSFHGRTLTTLSATGQDVFHKHFQPLTDGFVHIKPNDIDDFLSLITHSKVCAVILEPIQGEGGVLPLDCEYVKQVAEICQDRDILLMFDEVQTGIGRAGDWFAHKYFGVKPDAISFAKGIAGGLPLGGFIASEKLKNTLTAGLHATTFGGSPLVCAAALATLQILEDVVCEVNEKGEYIKQELSDIPQIKEIRGRGLMLGIAVDNPKEIQQKLMQEGLVCLTAGQDAIRLLPPLIITKEEIKTGIDIIKKVLGEQE